MTDYIEKQAALNCFNDWIDQYGDVHTADEMVEYQRIEALPAAPVREVRRGKWLDGYCSCCGERTVWDETDYCPNCGACMDMRGEE